MIQSLIKQPDSKAMLAAIVRLEKEMKKRPQVAIEYRHHFTPGVYSREMLVPAGTILVGSIHKTEHLSIFLQGRMLVPDENGNSIEIVAPMIEIAKPGVKRIGVALEDVRWITVHPTEETDIAKLEKLLVTNDYTDLIEEHK